MIPLHAVRSRLYRLLLVLAVLPLALAAIVRVPNVAAAGIVVTTTDDTLDAAGGVCSAITIGDLPGTDGVVSLREAVCAANGTAGADAITFAVDGTFTLSLSGTGEDNAATGDLDIRESLTIQGNGAAKTIVDGADADAIFDTFGTPAIVLNLFGVTLQNGAGIAATFPHAGALYVDSDDTATISESRILSNRADGNAGAIENRGTLTIDKTELSDNTANNEGGALRNIGQLTIADSTFNNNRAEFGGALWNSTANTTAVNISGTTFSGNHAEDRPGGPAGDFGDGSAIFNRTDGSLSVTRSTFTGNSAARDGGAIVSRDDSGTGVGSLTLSYSRVTGNTAAMPARSGIYNVDSTVLAENNWWGCNGPPSAPPCDQVAGVVDADPWLVLTHTANPATIATGAATTLTASLRQNSAGTAIDPANLSAFVGLPISFGNAVRGSISGAQPTIQSDGTATATFTAGAQVGVGSAVATLDQGSATATIQIDAADNRLFLPLVSTTSQPTAGP